MKALIWAIPFLIFISSCTSNVEKRENLLYGTWDASWELNDPGLKELYNSHQLKMAGTIVFQKENIISITAYGFEGCVFSADTAFNQLNFEVQDSLINIIDDDQEIIFSYLISEMNEKKVSLNLLNDIQLTLFKNN